MNPIELLPVQCPYCWEMIEVTVDCSQLHQSYIEDCSICCRPISLTIDISETGEINVKATSD